MTRPPSVAVDLTHLIPSSAPWTTPRLTMRTVSHRRGNVVRHKKTGDLTSATGHSHRFDRVQLTSGLTPQADIIADRRHV